MGTQRICDHKGYRIVIGVSWSTEPYTGNYQIMKPRTGGEWETIYHGFCLQLFHSKRDALAAAEAAARAYIRRIAA